MQSTEAIGYRLIQLMIAKFHDASCNKDYAASENDLRETKQVWCPVISSDKFIYCFNLESFYYT